MSDRLAVPSNITIVPLPAKCPELNPQENVWARLAKGSGRRSRMEWQDEGFCETTGFRTECSFATTTLSIIARMHGTSLRPSHGAS